MTSMTKPITAEQLAYVTNKQEDVEECMSFKMFDRCKAVKMLEELESIAIRRQDRRNRRQVQSSTTALVSVPAYGEGTLRERVNRVTYQSDYDAYYEDPSKRRLRFLKTWEQGLQHDQERLLRHPNLSDERYDRKYELLQKKLTLREWFQTPHETVWNRWVNMEEQYLYTIDTELYTESAEEDQHYEMVSRTWNDPRRLALVSSQHPRLGKDSLISLDFPKDLLIKIVEMASDYDGYEMERRNRNLSSMGGDNDVQSMPEVEVVFPIVV